MFSNCSCTNILALVATVLVMVYAYCKWCYMYWKRKGVPYLEPTIPVGNNDLKFWSKPMNEKMRHHYTKIRALGAKFAGLYFGLKPIFMVTDLDLIKQILVKDFNIFVSRGIYYNEESDPLSAHLFSLDGKKWKNLRAKLTPTFTSGKIKMVFPTLVDCGGPLKDYIENKTSKGEPVDIKDAMSRFTTNIIASCAFGLNCNTFENPENPFASMSESFFHPTSFQSLQLAFALGFPNLAKMFNMKITPNDARDFYMNVTQSLVKYREENNVSRKDFMQLLIELKNNENSEMKLSIDEISAQAYVFLLAGFETSSSTLTFACFELARNPDIQEKLREEIFEILKKHDNKITYESLHEMTYLLQVIEESLRMYPPALILRRVNSQDYKIPGTNVVLDKGTQVVMSAFGIQRDKEYYPEPNNFNPDRFSEENKKNRHPMSFLAFGGGQRACIGERFGLLEVKVGLIVLLTNFKISLNEKTKVPIVYDSQSAVLCAKDAIILDIENL